MIQEYMNTPLNISMTSAWQLIFPLTKLLQFIGDKWFIIFNTPKTKLVKFHHHRAAILMSAHTHKEAPWLERLMDLKLTLTSNGRRISMQS